MKRRNYRKKEASPAPDDVDSVAAGVPGPATGAEDEEEDVATLRCAEHCAAAAGVGGIAHACVRVGRAERGWRKRGSCKSSGSAALA